MIRQSRLLLLDTNIVIHPVRGGSIGQAIDARFQLRARVERPLISVVSLGDAERPDGVKPRRGDRRVGHRSGRAFDDGPRLRSSLPRYLDRVWIDPRNPSSS